MWEIIDRAFKRRAIRHKKCDTMTNILEVTVQEKIKKGRPIKQPDWADSRKCTVHAKTETSGEEPSIKYPQRLPTTTMMQGRWRVRIRHVQPWICMALEVKSQEENRYDVLIHTLWYNAVKDRKCERRGEKVVRWWLHSLWHSIDSRRQPHPSATITPHYNCHRTMVQ